uniref:Uncharacterized protein n=1 Tax=Anguilla anguilla TaxID=7936 RepID=A0A0E9WW40_ANGAN
MGKKRDHQIHFIGCVSKGPAYDGALCDVSCTTVPIQSSMQSNKTFHIWEVLFNLPPSERKNKNAKTLKKKTTFETLGSLKTFCFFHNFLAPLIGFIFVENFFLFLFFFFCYLLNLS